MLYRFIVDGCSYYKGVTHRYQGAETAMQQWQTFIHNRE